MKRWNVWGGDTITYEVPQPAREYHGGIHGSLQSLGGTIPHHNDTGTDHASFLPAEKGTLGVETIRSMCIRFNPGGLMHPGKLLAS